MNSRIKQYGTMRIWFSDERDTEFNESLDMEWPVYGEEDDELMSLEKIRNFAIAFARGMGFTDKSIGECFGEW